MTLGMAQGDRCSCGPAQQASKTIPLICHLIPLSTGLHAVTEPAQRAHYARLYAAAGFGRVGKQMKRRSRSPEILLPVTADKVEEIAS